MANDGNLTAAEIEAAIEKLINGGAVQSYSIGARTLSRFSLTELYELKRKIEKDQAAAARGRLSFGKLGRAGR